MAYKAKFLHFKTKQSYNTERNKTSAGTDERKVFDAYISFIDEGPTICTWGKEYKCELSKDEIESLIDSKGFITIDDIPDIPDAGTITPKVAGTATIGTSTKYAREDHIHPAQTSVSGNAGTATKLETARTINLIGDVTGSTSFDGSQNTSITTTVSNDSHTHSNSTITSLDASKLTGTIDIARLPKGALERLVIAENQTARFQLTSEDVQEGDTVKQEDTGVMYFVVDINNLSNENGYKIYTAGSATSVPWSGVTDKPSTFTPSTHNQSSNTITSLTGYTKGTNSAISTTDSLNTALGKLETKVDLKANASDLSNYLLKTETAISANKLATPRSISLDTGVSSTATDFDGSKNITIPITSIKESYIEFGGKNFSNSNSAIDAILLDSLSADRFAYFKSEGVTVEYSRDGGESWLDYGASDSDKEKLFYTSSSSGATFYIGKASSSDIANQNYQLRITLDSQLGSLDTEINKFAISCTINGSTGSTVTIQTATKSSPTEFKNLIDNVAIGGWPGWNIINTFTPFRSFNSASTNAQTLKIRFIFKITSQNASYAGLIIHRICAFGGVGWGTPSIMAKTGHIYEQMEGGVVKFPNLIYTSGISSFTENRVKVAASGGVIGFYCDNTNNSVYPFRNNTINLGTSSSQWKDAYIVTTHGNLDGNATTATTANKTVGKLTFTGSVSGTFDGSTNININIPSSGTVTSVKLTQGTGIIINNSGVAITTSGERTISLKPAFSTELGGVKPFSSYSYDVQYANATNLEIDPLAPDPTGVLVNSVSNVANRYYAIETDLSGHPFVNVPWVDNNYYPTTFQWTNGTTNGPTGLLTGNGMTGISFSAIPSASSSISGIVTARDQEFGGRKTFTNGIIVNNISGGELYIDDADNIGATAAGPGFHIFAENDLHIISMENNRVYFGMDDECYIEADTFSGTANMAKKVTNPLTITKGSTVTTYDGSAAESIIIPAIANLNLSEHTYTSESTLSILKGGCYYHTGSSTASTITLIINTMSWSSSIVQNETPDSAIIVIEGTTTVKFTSNTKLKLQNNIPLTGTSGTYRVYAFQKINSNLIMVNCAVYKNS